MVVGSLYFVMVVGVKDEAYQASTAITRKQGLAQGHVSHILISSFMAASASFSVSQQLAD